MTRTGGVSTGATRERRAERTESSIRQRRREARKPQGRCDGRLGCRDPSRLNAEAGSSGGRQPRTARRGQRTSKGCERNRRRDAPVDLSGAAKATGGQSTGPVTRDPRRRATALESGRRPPGTAPGERAPEKDGPTRRPQGAEDASKPSPPDRTASRKPSRSRASRYARTARTAIFSERRASRPALRTQGLRAGRSARVGRDSLKRTAVGARNLILSCSLTGGRKHRPPF